jgi:hypothetical protein
MPCLYASKFAVVASLPGFMMGTDLIRHVVYILRHTMNLGSGMKVPAKLKARGQCGGSMPDL